MKRNFPLLLIIFFTLNLFSQKCADHNDPFSNERIISFDFNNKTVYYELKKDKIHLEITFYYWGERNYIFDENTEIFFKLEDDKKVVLKSVEKAVPKIEQICSSSTWSHSGMTVSMTENFSAYSFVFNPEIEDLRNFSNSKIKLIRIPGTNGEGYNDLKVKIKTKKKTKAIKKGASCILEHIIET